MPKASGAPMKTIQLLPLPLPQARKIQSFAQPAPGGQHVPPHHPRIRSSNEVAAHAVKVASTPGTIDPRQMRDSDPSNID